jgi:DNA-binding transcriptional MerR regulator
MNIKEVAELAKVSVRTLHHYDKIGLLVPARNEWNGYRAYSDADLTKLQQICFFKACGFPLVEIQTLLDSSQFDQEQAFALQKSYLLQEKAQIETILATLERSVQALKGEVTMTQAEKFKGFDFTRENPYEAEARERWGKQAIDHSQVALTALSDTAKQALSGKMTDLFHDLAKVKDEDPASEVAQAAINQMYHFFNDNLGYHYSLAAFAGLGQLYVQDERFTENLSQYGIGLPEFLATAMTIYAETHQD